MSPNINSIIKQNIENQKKKRDNSAIKLQTPKKQFESDFVEDDFYQNIEKVEPLNPFEDPLTGAIRNI